LLITITLVVMVIFLFLRNVWATIIPGVTVPLALLGTCAVMYVAHYSLENVYRHVEAGLSPKEAALKGAGEIGFTIMSISLSLIAVFIPLLLMGGIIGRLFREFAITVTVTILVSVVVSLTLTPMMCARFLQDERHAKHGKLYLLMERFFDG